MTYIPKNIEKFIKTPEGKKEFSKIIDKIGNSSDRAKRHDRKKAFLFPSENVCRWLDTLALLEKAGKKINKSKK